jgi:hypothetical protein
VKKRILIPRKDHEVYISPFSGKTGKKSVRYFAEETLRALHPGFSDTSVFDTVVLSVNDKTFLIITVMVKTTLAEYRLLNPRSIFFTATSLFLNMSGAENAAAVELADERIGFMDTGEPYSEPCDNPVAAGSEEYRRVQKLLKTAKGKNAVFKKRSRHPVIISVVGVLTTILAGVLYYPIKKAPYVPPAAEPVLEKDVIPTVFETLSDISGHITKVGGTMTGLRYDVYSDPEINIAVKGPDVEHIFDITKKIPYLALFKVSDVRYTEKKAQYDAAFSFRYDDYASLQPYIPESGDALFSLLSEVRTGIRDRGASIVSETLPVRENGFEVMVNFTGGRKPASEVFSFLGEKLSQSGVGVTRMNISYENSRFDVTITFVPILDVKDTAFVSGLGETLVTAFAGVEQPRQNPPPKPVVKPVIKNQNEGREEYDRIGVIRDNDGTSYIYYKTKKGNMVVERE